MDKQQIAHLAAAIRMAVCNVNPPLVKFSGEKTSKCCCETMLKVASSADFAEQVKLIKAALSSASAAPCCVQIDGVGVFDIEKPEQTGRLAGKISIVTGSAQGFGLGIAEEMLDAGALVVIADLNIAQAQAEADRLAKIHGANRVIAASVDVGNEESVQNLIYDTAAVFGGLDIFVNNAGVLKAGSLEEMTVSAFEFVTKINYNAYFICTKYAAEIMKVQNMVAPDYMMDIIQINSKSGLEGSNKNFAYAGSKFGGLGLTQSFALELIPYNIKVNAICPGNLLGGPLWTDPERGLFVQYLKAGKVPGAKTIEDVKKFYEAKVPMGRGCEIKDVFRALAYIVEQEYETGQAVPVTGGQVMLK